MVENEDSFDNSSDKRIENNVMRHEYRTLNDLEKMQMKNIKDQGLILMNYIDSLGQKREYSLAKTKIEEAIMWAVKGITQ